MKITVIHGNSHHGSTWHCMDLFRQELEKEGTIEITEFTLPKDMPQFCNGCFSCFIHGEETCPHAEKVHPIVQSLLTSDLIVLTSSVYGLDVTGQLKALLDHLCFMWLSHRPQPSMFRKVGLTIVTTAGAGLKHTTKTMKNSLTFWGVKRVYTFQNAVSAMKWEDVSEKKKEKIQYEISKTAKKITKSVRNIDQLSSPIFRSILFHAMASMMKKNDWNPYDKKHWETNGWLNGKKPF